MRIRTTDQRRPRVAAILIVAALASCGTPLPEGADATAPDNEPREQVIQLTDSGARNGQPSWSPDGGRLAFVSDRSGQWEVWTSDADGTAPRQVTDGNPPVGWPSWTHDGASILFYAPGGDGYRIYRVEVENGAVEPFWNGIGSEFRPTLDPGGNRLLYDRAGAGADSHDLVVADLGDGSERLLTDDTAYDSDARWSPDGRSIVFHSDRDRGGLDTNVFLLDLDTGETTQLTDDAATNGYPAWSPDGRRIVYTSELDGNRDLWVMEADGGDRRRLTAHPGFDGDPIWLPDGSGILFATDRFGGLELAVLMFDAG